MDQNIFQRFPKIGDQIMSQLDLPTLLNCTLVCKDWNSFLNDPFFWLKKLKDVGQPIEIETSWKNLIIKSVEIGVNKQFFGKCLKKKFQHFVESESKGEFAQRDAILWMKFPPLHTASLFGEIEIVKLIYHFNVDFNRPLLTGTYWNGIECYEMPIFVAIENGHNDIVKFIANTPREMQNPSINYSAKSLIYVAILKKNFDLVKFFVPKTKNINKYYGKFRKDTLIHACVRTGDIDILKYLLSIPGINPNVKNYRDNQTPLQILCTEEFISWSGLPLEVITEMVKILIPLEDANNPKNFDNGVNSPLYDAAENGSIEILTTLLKYLDANVKRRSGLKPIHKAIQRNQIEAVKILAPFTKELDIHENCYHSFIDNSESIELMKSLIEERNRISED